MPLPAVMQEASNQDTDETQAPTPSATTSTTRLLVSLLCSVFVLLTFVPAAAAAGDTEDDTELQMIDLQHVPLPTSIKDELVIDLPDCAEPGIGTGCDDDDDTDPEPQGPGPGCIVNCGPDKDPTPACETFGCDDDFASEPPPDCAELLLNGCDDDDEEDPTPACETFGCDDDFASEPPPDCAELLLEPCDDDDEEDEDED